VLLRDTKNRSDHKPLLSTQALEIAKRYCAGRQAEDPLFPIVDARKTLAWINERAGTNVQGHGLRATAAATNFAASVLGIQNERHCPAR
jgi:integrase